MSNENISRILPNGQSQHDEPSDADTARLQARVDELEDLCGELYDLGVEVGVPQVFLNRLWTIASQGNEPRAFEFALDVAVAAEGAIIDAPSVANDEGLPDIRLVHSVVRPPRSACVPMRPLAPLPDRRRVMVVDDDPAILAMILRVLATENYQVVWANSGPEALEKLTEPIDLLITDYVMPIINGRQLAEQVRRRCPQVKVLYETGFTDLLFAGQVEVERGAAFVEKPYSARGLIEAARLALFGYIQLPAAEKSA
jgi:CheY-like chemotaxis protein